MKERPILFNGEMVRAILNGKKTQTRRVIKLQPLGPGYLCRKTPRYINGNPNAGRLPGNRWAFDREGGGFWGINFDCPYGQPGDRLWVRESICTDMADGIGLVWNHCASPSTGYKLWEGKEPKRIGAKIPSIHMPRWASRITLEVTDIRVRRLQEIDFWGMQAEGCIPKRFCGGERQPFIDKYWKPLWDSINAKRGYGWEANPWVWCLSFRMIP